MQQINSYIVPLRKVLVFLVNIKLLKGKLKKPGLVEQPGFFVLKKLLSTCIYMRS